MITIFHRIVSSLRKTAPAVVCAGMTGLFAPSVSMAQQTTLTEGFYDIRELERLMKIAQESGFSEEELKEITIEDHGTVLNAWDYLQEQKRLRELAEKEERERREKKYLTVKDIFSDLEKKEEGDLQQVRDTSVFVD